MSPEVAAKIEQLAAMKANRQLPSQQTGSWLPSLVLLFIIAILYLLFSQSLRARMIRREFAMYKIWLTRKMGKRDESKYKMKAGDGANEKLKRQG
jgi:hypothetical protein